MAHAVKASTVRIFSKKGLVVGAGFLGTKKHVLTCAHVVADALGLTSDCGKAPSSQVLLDFPLITSGDKIAAKIAKWPPAETDSADSEGWKPDLAVLELAANPPAGADPARVVAAEEFWDQGFRVYGFPRDMTKVYGHRDDCWRKMPMAGCRLRQPSRLGFL